MNEQNHDYLSDDDASWEALDDSLSHEAEVKSSPNVSFPSSDSLLEDVAQMKKCRSLDLKEDVASIDLTSSNDNLLNFDAKQMNRDIKDELEWESIPIANAIDSEKYSARTTKNSETNHSSDTSTLKKSINVKGSRTSNDQDNKKFQPLSGSSKKPIHLLWVRFIVHFARELWMSGSQVQIGTAFILAGFVLNSLRLSLWYITYPRQIIGVVLFVAPVIYMNATPILKSIDVIAAFSKSPQHFTAALSEVDSKILRQVTMVLVFVFPFCIELRTIYLLVQIHTKLGSWMHNIATAFCIGVIMLYKWKRLNEAPRVCLDFAMLILYGSALMLSLGCFHLADTAVLAGPLLIPSGVLILQRKLRGDPDWISQCVQKALRLTIRDALGLVGEDTLQDEMFQLTMLRWLVDYWDFESKKTGCDTTTNDSKFSDTSTFSRLSENSSQSGQDQNTKKQNMEWSELSSMLSLTTDHLSDEISSIQGMSKTSPVSSGTSEYKYKIAVKNDPLQSLHQMFVDMDIDVHARPAVQAYKHMIHSFPPSRETALLSAVIRRCPSCVLLVWHLFFGQLESMSSMTILLVLASFEVLRVHHWSDICCQLVCRKDGILNNRHLAWSRHDIDAMVYLLVDDTTLRLTIPRMPHLLLVWNNAKLSVSALEKGLVSVQIVQTATLGAEFAGNIISLVNFGIEISEKGWFHGLTVFGKEMVLLHSKRNNNDFDDTIPNERDPRLQYSNAALGTIRNSQRIKQNVETLVQDEEVVKIIQPVISFLPTIIGRGWLWERPVKANCSQSSKSDGLEIIDESNPMPPENSAISTHPNLPKSAKYSENLTSNQRYEEGPNVKVSESIDEPKTTRQQDKNSSPCNEYLSIAQKSKWITPNLLDLPIIQDVNATDVLYEKEIVANEIENIDSAPTQEYIEDKKMYVDQSKQTPDNILSLEDQNDAKEGLSSMESLNPVIPETVDISLAAEESNQTQSKLTAKSQSDEFISMAKKSKWIAPDLFEQALTLHGCSTPEEVVNKTD